MRTFRPYMLIPAQIVPYKPLPSWMRNRHRYAWSRYRRQSVDSIMRYHGDIRRMKVFRISESPSEVRE